MRAEWVMQAEWVERVEWVNRVVRVVRYTHEDVTRDFGEVCAVI